MNQSTHNTDPTEAAYQKALLKLESIAERHKREIDAYIAELNQAKIDALQKELQA